MGNLIKFTCFFIILINCRSVTPTIETPPNYLEMRDEIEKDETIPYPAKEKIVNTLRDAEDYGNRCYAENKKLVGEKNAVLSQLEKAKAEFLEKEKELNDEIKELKESLETYRILQFLFFGTIAIIVIYYLWKFFGPLLKKMYSPI